MFKELSSMQPNLKKILRALSLDLRHTLEGWYDNTGAFHPGDLETRLNALGVWRERVSKPIEELPYLSTEDKTARQVIDAYIAYRAEAEVSLADAVAEFVRESAYNWANRLFALRCMEARGIIDEVILQKEIYGGRSLVHNRLARKNPEACAGPDEGLFAVLFQEFEERAKELPELFAPDSPAIELRPSLSALKRCLALISGTLKANGQESASDEVFTAPDVLGWAYQYWNAEEKERIFEKIKLDENAKIEADAIIPATQMYTDPYMVEFLVQNSLGALWMNMHPASKINESWEYYVKDADRVPAEIKTIEDIDLLDPACGSGHFLLEGFDLFFQMYQEENGGWNKDQIAAAILNQNLYGIDIDERAVQITTAALWMKAKEYAPDLLPETLTSFHHHLVATNIHLPKGKDHLKTFLDNHLDAAPLQPALEAIFEGLGNVDELGTLVQIEEPVDKELKYLKNKYEEESSKPYQASLFPSLRKPIQGELPTNIESYSVWKNNIFVSLRNHFVDQAASSDIMNAFFGHSGEKSLQYFDLISKKFDIVISNPPWMGYRNMGTKLKQYVSKIYSSGKGDLFASFILRSIQLTKPGGYIGMVTQQSWLYLRSFSDIRIDETGEGILVDNQIECLANLGRYAFSELGNAVINPALFTIRNIKNSPSHKVYAIKLNEPRQSDIQAQILMQAAKNQHFGNFVTTIEQDLFLRIPGAPIVFWFSEDIINLFNGPNIGEISLLANRTKTGNNEKFMRFIWEIQSQVGEGQEWLIYQKGGEYKTYFGNNIYVIKWSKFYKRHFREDPNCRITDDKYCCVESLTYNGLGQQFSCRLTPNLCTYDVAGPALIGSHENLILAAAFLNSPYASFILKALNTTLSFQSSDVLSVPIVYQQKDTIQNLASEAIELKKKICSSDILEYSFEGLLPLQMKNEIEELFLAKKKEIDSTILDLLIPKDYHLEFKLPPETDFEKKQFGDFSETQQKIEYEQDIFSVVILRLLGHRWPKKIEDSEPIPDWADPDGIIPLTLGLQEHTLLERVRAHPPEEFPGSNFAALEREFEEIMGESLEKWLNSSFFKHHISQFKKRPIAWQISSHPANGVTSKGKKMGLDKTPAFSCLVYYHKLDLNTLTNMQSQYIRPLRQSYETELRTLDNSAFLTPDQSSRRLQLEAWIDELKDFEGRLEQCAREGFGSSLLKEIAEKAPLDGWTSRDGKADRPADRAEFEAQEMRYDPDINDGVRVNIAPLQKYGLLAADVLDVKDIEKAIADRAEWRADERRWCRDGKLPQLGWWK
jgi:hypothetical protein